MAAFAILLYGEGVLAFEMAGAARFGRLHLRHCHPLVLRGRLIEFDVAIAALVHACVQLVAELSVSRILHLEFHLPDGMAPGAFIDLEGAFAVMAGAAGLPLFHLGHGDRLLGNQVVEPGMADSALVGGDEMLFMTEGHRSGLPDLHDHIPDFMALYAIGETEGLFAVVAGAAGFPLFHVRHGETDPGGLRSEVENGIVAGLAVVLDPLLQEVPVVAEYHLAEIGYLDGDILDVDGISERTGQNRPAQDQ